MMDCMQRLYSHFHMGPEFEFFVVSVDVYVLHGGLGGSGFCTQIVHN